MLEPIVYNWVSAMQRGFLHGRSMLANIIEVDHEAMKISLKHSRGAVILFDFAAAFPSISQEYVWEVLEHVGVAGGPLQAIKRLYINNLHHIKIKSCVFPSFVATSGVRQGCPLSPLLFCLVADVLLRRLQSMLPNSFLRAFADDTAAVVQDFDKCAPTILSIFKDFARISNLQLNLKKTVLMPLWESSHAAVLRWLKDDHPQWSHVEIAWGASYLGFLHWP